MRMKPLVYQILSECDTTKARTAVMTLPHYSVETPVFMPVGTQGTLKGLLPDQLEALDVQIILGNTYHLGTRPGSEIIKKAGGLHNFIGWKRAMLTDSGGFQMVSLLKLAEITEEGVKFQSPFGAGECMLTPEHSLSIQNDLGADIAMQLDDVVSSTVTDVNRVEEAMLRTTRWLDRCLAVHARPHDQNLFPIVQGGLDEKLRERSAKLHVQRDVNGFAIGGLSGGESKDEFWKMVHLSTDNLPREKPRYVMGVGYAEDILVCVALGADMFDCVFPTRTARFGCALLMTGQIDLKHKQYEKDFGPIDKDCTCSTCKNFTRSYLNYIAAKETVGCHLITVHNVAFQMRLMREIREHIKKKSFPDYVRRFMLLNYPHKNYPKWSKEAFAAVNIHLDT